MEPGLKEGSRHVVGAPALRQLANVRRSFVTRHPGCAACKTKRLANPAVEGWGNALQGDVVGSLLVPVSYHSRLACLCVD